MLKSQRCRYNLPAGFAFRDSLEDHVRNNDMTSLLINAALALFFMSILLNSFVALRKRGTSWMHLLLTVGVLAALIGVMIRPEIFLPTSLFGASSMPDIKLVSTYEIANRANGNACMDRKICVAVYLSPNCPACHAALPFVSALQRRVSTSSEIGMQIYVGSGSKQEVLKMAQTLPGNVYLDPDSKMLSALGLGGYPYWWVYSADGKILRFVAGSPTDVANVERIDEFLRDRLKINM